MSTINHKIEMLNAEGTQYDTYHPETNTNQIYDFTKSKWLNEIIDEIELQLSIVSGGINIEELVDELNLAMESVSSIEDLIETIQSALTLKYTKPSGGIPLGDLEATVKASLANADRMAQIETDLKRYIDQQDESLKLDVLNEIKVTTGDLALLNTDNKDNLVDAINEISLNSGGASSVRWEDVLNKPELETVSGSQSKIDAHANNSNIHITSAEKTKLSGVEAGANKYTHPTNHPASIITQTSSAKFVTDTQISAWNAKVDTSTFTGHTSNSDIHMTSEEKTKLSGIASNANNYVHPNNHSASIITQTALARFVTDAQINAWNAKLDTSALTGHINDLSVHMTSEEKTKLNGIASNANNYVHPTSHPASIITQTSSARFVTDTQISNWNAKLDSSSSVTVLLASTLNGWTGTINYYKDSTDRVYVYGLVMGGIKSIGVNLFQLPVGYRPSSDVNILSGTFDSMDNASTMAWCVIRTDGHFNNIYHSLKHTTIVNFSFKA